MLSEVDDNSTIVFDASDGVLVGLCEASRWFRKADNVRNATST